MRLGFCERPESGKVQDHEKHCRRAYQAVRGARVFERWHCLRCQMRRVFVAMSMYEVATGKTPFDGMTSEQVSHELRTKDSRPNIPDNMYDLVDGKYIKLMREAWSTNPDDRPSMSTITRTLQHICKNSGPFHYKPLSAPSANGGSKAEVKARQQLRQREKRSGKKRTKKLHG